MTNGETTVQFAKTTGIDRRHVLRLCKAGMTGATFDESAGKWLIDPVPALEWIKSNTKSLSNRIAIDVASIVAKAEAPTASGIRSEIPLGQESSATVPDQGQPSSTLEKQVRDLGTVADVLLAVLKTGKFEPRAATMLKQCLSEIRLTEAHVAEMKLKAGNMMALDDALRLLASFATIFRVTMEGIAQTWPDIIVAAGVEAKVISGDDFQRAIMTIRAAMEERTGKELTTLADTIERMEREAIDRAANLK